MTMVLILSSHVAASRVGGRVSVSALEAHGIDTTFCPTTLLGRHPGHGEPGGSAVPAEQFGSMLEGVAAHGLFGLTDAVLTGYFASVEQVEIAAAAIAEIRQAPRRRGQVKAQRHAPIIMVDPILGDSGTLYVKEEVAIAIRDLLVPLADIITPNAFELSWLSGQPVNDVVSARKAVSVLEPSVLVTSLIEAGPMTNLLSMSGECWICQHQRLENAPNGTGDLLAAEFLACLLEDTAAPDALKLASEVTLDAALKARDWQAFELPDIGARKSELHADAKIDLRAVTA